MSDSIIIADANFQRAYDTVQRLHHAGLSNPVRYTRSVQALQGCLSAYVDQATRRLAAVLIDLDMFMADGEDILSFATESGLRSIPLTVLVNSPADAKSLQQCRFRNVCCLQRPVDARDFVDIMSRQGRWWAVLGDRPGLGWAARALEIFEHPSGARMNLLPEQRERA